MHPLYVAYKALTSGLFIFLFPLFWAYPHLTGRYLKGRKERLGFIAHRIRRKPHGSLRVWIHAASLGEVKAAASITEQIKDLIPGCETMLSATTEHGHELARQILEEDTAVYAPLDLFFSVRRALSLADPDLMVFMETELWPAWLTEAHRMGIKTALIHGRISSRSIKRYRKLRPFFRSILENMDAFSMISEEDARRIRRMGADGRKIEIHGNAKYDYLTRLVDPSIEAEMRKILNLRPAQPVFVAGSTRSGEEPIILDVYERISKVFPDTVLVIAPRHIVRTSAIESLLRRRGLPYQLGTLLNEDGVKRTAPVVILNTFGELFDLYSVGTVIFCGASLVPRGGQNPIEPAVWGKVVLYGPFMEDFLDAKALLEKQGAGIEVSSTDAFVEKAIWLLKHPDLAGSYGDRGRAEILKNQGAGRGHAEVIARLLK
ncbi:MAG: glycosyltransferase N-terminal domain-containing protein [Deltaproteobacteria bacterium]|jgi:3-deoxy-D-manno-octulosonic-acid transferase